jgi:hypothetical protein
MKTTLATILIGLALATVGCNSKPSMTAREAQERRESYERCIAPLDEAHFAWRFLPLVVMVMVSATTGLSTVLPAFQQR